MSKEGARMWSVHWQKYWRSLRSQKGQNTFHKTRQPFCKRVCCFWEPLRGKTAGLRTQQPCRCPELEVCLTSCMLTSASRGPFASSPLWPDGGLAQSSHRNWPVWELLTQLLGILMNIKAAEVGTWWLSGLSLGPLCCQVYIWKQLCYMWWSTPKCFKSFTKVFHHSRVQCQLILVVCCVTVKTSLTLTHTHIFL